MKKLADIFEMTSGVRRALRVLDGAKPRIKIHQDQHGKSHPSKPDGESGKVKTPALRSTKTGSDQHGSYHEVTHPRTGERVKTFVPVKEEIVITEARFRPQENSTTSVDHAHSHVSGEMGRLLHMIRPGGSLHKAHVAQGGDPSHLEDAHKHLSAAMSAHDEAHYTHAMAVQQDWHK